MTAILRHDQFHGTRIGVITYSEQPKRTWHRLPAVLLPRELVNEARCAGEWDLFDQTIKTRTVRSYVQHLAIRDALTMCAECPVMQQCGEYAEGLNNAQRGKVAISGVWGGKLWEEGRIVKTS